MTAKGLRDAAVTGMFIAEGLSGVCMEDVLNAWNGSTRGGGYIELMESIAHHVPFIIEERDKVAAQNDHDFPGVFEYEVASEFGAWYGLMLINTCDVPNEGECHDWIRRKVGEFFEQSKWIWVG